MKETAITFHINGRERTFHARNADTLLYVLREKLGLTGAKPGCLNGDCGACTIDIDGVPMKACIMLAVEGIGKNITTIEGLKQSTLQTAFIENFAFQCGYCTPGFIMNSQSLINHHPNANDATIRTWLESNICRCTGYEEIENAVKEAINKVKTKSKDATN